MTARKARRAQYVDESTDPRYLEYWDRQMDGLRNAGMPEERPLPTASPRSSPPTW